MKTSGTGATPPKRPGRGRVGSWLGAFIALPEGAWLAASLRSGFREKKVSNLSMEPVLVAILSIAVFGAWFLMARRGLKALPGVVLLILLCAAALAIQRYVPALHE